MQNFFFVLFNHVTLVFFSASFFFLLNKVVLKFDEISHVTHVTNGMFDEKLISIKKIGGVIEKMWNGKQPEFNKWIFPIKRERKTYDIKITLSISLWECRKERKTWLSSKIHTIFFGSWFNKFSGAELEITFFWLVISLHFQSCQ